MTDSKFSEVSPTLAEWHFIVQESGITNTSIVTFPQGNCWVGPWFSIGSKHCHYLSLQNGVIILIQLGMVKQSQWTFSIYSK